MTPLAISFCHVGRSQLKYAISIQWPQYQSGVRESAQSPVPIAFGDDSGEIMGLRCIEAELKVEMWVPSAVLRAVAYRTEDIPRVQLIALRPSNEARA